MKTPVAKAVGPVEAAILNHHGYVDTMNAVFVAALQPRVWVISVWDAAHPTGRVWNRLRSQRVYKGPRDIFATDAHDAALTVIGGLSGLASRHGHIVIRVAPGGGEYRVLIVDDSSESHRITKVSGWQIALPTHGTHRACVDLAGVRSGKGCGKIAGTSSEKGATRPGRIFKAGSMGKTRSGRDMLLYTITDPGVPEAGKRVVLFTTLQHDIETTGAMAIEGICTFLLCRRDAKEFHRYYPIGLCVSSRADAKTVCVLDHVARTLWLADLREAERLAAERGWIRAADGLELELHAT